MKNNLNFKTAWTIADKNEENLSIKIFRRFILALCLGSKKYSYLTETQKDEVKRLFVKSNLKFAECVNQVTTKLSDEILTEAAEIKHKYRNQIYELNARWYEKNKVQVNYKTMTDEQSIELAKFSLSDEGKKLSLRTFDQIVDTYLHGGVKSLSEAISLVISAKIINDSTKSFSKKVMTIVRGQVIVTEKITDKVGRANYIHLNQLQQLYNHC